LIAIAYNKIAQNLTAFTALQFKKTRLAMKVVEGHLKKSAFGSLADYTLISCLNTHCF